MNDREWLHWIVDGLEDDVLDEARRALGAFCTDPAVRALMMAPLDDEPLTEKDRQAIERGRSGPWMDDEDVGRLLEDVAGRLVG